MTNIVFYKTDRQYTPMEVKPLEHFNTLMLIQMQNDVGLSIDEEMAKDIRNPAFYFCGKHGLLKINRCTFVNVDIPDNLVPLLRGCSTIDMIVISDSQSYKTFYPLVQHVLHFPEMVKLWEWTKQSSSQNGETKSGKTTHDDCSTSLGSINPSSKDRKIEEQPEELDEQQILLDSEIQGVIDDEIARRGGQVYVRYKPRNKRPYAFDFALIGNRFFILVYANIMNCWIADEEDFVDNKPPYWFSETGLKISPVFQAMTCRDFFARELPGIKIDSVVVLPQDCFVINDDDMLECWEKECNTTVVRTKTIEETCLMTLQEHLDSLPVNGNRIPQLNTDETNEITSYFTEYLDGLLN